MIFAGKINTDILASLRHRSVHAVGLSGVDGNIVHAERRPPKEIVNRETGESEHVDFGHVGDILEINARLLTVLLDHGQQKAEKLVLLSDVDGIFLRAGEPQTKLSRLTANEEIG